MISKEASAALGESGSASVKSATAYKTIREVSDETGVAQHVLRFWESKFDQLKPLKRGGGRRYYRPEDMALIHKIHRLLEVEGYTLRGVQKVLDDMAAAAPSRAPAMPQPAAKDFARTRARLSADSLGTVDELPFDLELLNSDTLRLNVLKELISELKGIRKALDKS